MKLVDRGSVVCAIADNYQQNTTLDDAATIYVEGHRRENSDD
jgi:hypothetical protein